MIGQNEIVVDRLGNADKADRTFDLRRIAGKLADGVHRVVAADVKEIADVQPLQFFKEDAVEAVREVLREFKTAGTQIRRRSQAKKFQIVIGECFWKVHIRIREKALDSIYHTVDAANRIAVARTFADNTVKAPVDNRGRSAGLSD